MNNPSVNLVYFLVMSHILVEWEGESPKVYSVCKRSDIADGELRNPEVQLIGKVVPIQWKRREYPGKILQLGKLLGRQ